METQYNNDTVILNALKMFKYIASHHKIVYEHMLVSILSLHLFVESIRFSGFIQNILLCFWILFIRMLVMKGILEIRLC